MGNAGGGIGENSKYVQTLVLTDSIIYIMAGTIFCNNKYYFDCSSLASYDTSTGVYVDQVRPAIGMIASMNLFEGGTNDSTGKANNGMHACVCMCMYLSNM